MVNGLVTTLLVVVVEDYTRLLAIVLGKNIGACDGKYARRIQNINACGVLNARCQCVGVTFRQCVGIAYAFPQGGECECSGFYDLPLW